MDQGNEPNLSPHLREVARRLARGQTNRQMAEAMFVTQHTIEKYVSELKRLLGARDRVDLAFKSRKLGS